MDASPLRDTTARHTFTRPRQWARPLLRSENARPCLRSPGCTSPCSGRWAWPNRCSTCWRTTRRSSSPVGAEPVDIVLFAVALVALPPLVLLAIEAAAWLVSVRLRRALHLVLIWLLSALLVLQFLRWLAERGTSGLLIPLAMVGGVAATAAYARTDFVRACLTVLSPAPVLFLVAFLFFSPVTKLVTAGEASVHLADSRSAAPVVFLMLDEFPLVSLLRSDGRIDDDRYPHFAALAEDATWMRHTVSPDSQTEYAVPAALTGRWPRAGALPILADHPDNLFTLLGRSHQMKVMESVTRLCPPDLCRRVTPGFGERLRSLASDLSVVALHLTLPADLRTKLPSISGTWQDFRGGPRIPARRRHVDRVAEGRTLRVRLLGPGPARPQVDSSRLHRRHPPRSGRWTPAVPLPAPRAAAHAVGVPALRAPLRQGQARRRAVRPLERRPVRRPSVDINAISSRSVTWTG